MMNYIGEILQQQEKEVNSNILDKKDIIGLYFSASWCMPCRHFTPKLAQFYNLLKQNNKLFEVIFVSRDHSNFEFLEYYHKMPWLSIPFYDQKRIDYIYNIFKPRGIPYLVILDNQGNVLSKDGKYDIETKGLEAFEHWQNLKVSAQKKD